MKNLFKIFALLLILSSSLVHAEEREKLKGTFLVETETFLLWYAKQQGWDEELGFDFDLNIVQNSGSDILHSHASDPDNWHVCGVGAVPATIYSENLHLDLIGIANDESFATEILVKANDPILKDVGWDQEFPHAKGTPETIKGKTFLVRKNTSSFYTLLCYLDIFGLNLNDINFVDSLPSQAVADLHAGKGDAAIMWSPHSYDAERLGYVSAGNAQDVGAYVPVVFIADRDFASAHKELIAKFLALYLRAVDKQKKNLKSLIKPYQEFLKKYAGKNYSEEFCEFDLDRHPVYSLANQLSAFNSRGNRPSAIVKLKRKLLNSFTLISMELGKPKNFMTHDFDLNPTDTYLKAAQKYVHKE